MTAIDFLKSGRRESVTVSLDNSLEIDCKERQGNGTGARRRMLRAGYLYPYLPHS